MIGSRLDRHCLVQRQHEAVHTWEHAGMAVRLQQILMSAILQSNVTYRTASQLPMASLYMCTAAAAAAAAAFIDRTASPE